MILKLPLLDDFSRLLTENFRNKVFLITEDKPIKCSGAVLAARSSVLEGMIEDSNNIPAIEFSDNIPGLYSCLRVLYGGSISIDITNYKSLFKFGKLFQIQEMMECVLKWVSEELSYDMFWDVSQELSKMGVALNSECFRDVIERFISNNYNEFWHYIKNFCLENDEIGVKTIFDTLFGTEVISCEDVLTFLSDLLDIVTDKEQTPSSSNSTSQKYINTVVTCTISYLENRVKSALNSSCCLCSKYLDILKKLSSVCNELESLRRISFLQNDAYSIPKLLLCKEIDLCTTTGLTRELIQKLTNPATTYDTICYFTEYAAKGLHPCVIGEIVINWWRVSCTEYHDISFIKTLFAKIEDIYDTWLYDVSCDVRFRELVITLRLITDTNTFLYHYCSHDNNNLIVLKQCIEKGDGTDLTFATNCIRNTEDMEVYRDNMPVFRYNTAIFPPYGVCTGHWYMAFCKEDYSHNLVSLTTESQQSILSYFESCYLVELYFIPSPDSN